MFKTPIMVTAAGPKDIAAIKRLQELNHFKNVSAQERKKRGFVSVETSKEVLLQIARRTGIVVAKANNELIGYEMPLPLEQAKTITLLEPFIARFDSVTYKGRKISDYNLVIAGQICVGKEYSGKGVPEIMHPYLLHMILKGKFDLLVTEVSGQNTRSLHVSVEKLGFQLADQYCADGQSWYVLVQEIPK